MELIEKIDGVESSRWTTNEWLKDSGDFLSMSAEQLKKLEIGHEYSVDGFENIRQLRNFAEQMDVILTVNCSFAFEVKRHEGVLDISYRRLL